MDEQRTIRITSPGWPPRQPIPPWVTTTRDILGGTSIATVLATTVITEPGTLIATGIAIMACAIALSSRQP